MNKDAIRVVLIEDDKVIRESYAFLINKTASFQVVNAYASAEQAFKSIKNDDPLIVLLDVELPGMNGIEALNEIKNTNKNLPVILCSAYGEFKQDFSSWASDGYVVKSADTKELKQTIKDLLSVAKPL